MLKGSLRQPSVSFSCISMCGAMACSASCCLAVRSVCAVVHGIHRLTYLNLLWSCCLQEHFADDFDAVAAANAGKPVLMTGMCFQAACILACLHLHTPAALKQHPAPVRTLHTPSSLSCRSAISRCVSRAMIMQYASSIAATKLVWCLAAYMTIVLSAACAYNAGGVACSR